MPCNLILVIDDDQDDLEIFLSAMAVVTDTIACVTLNSSTEALRRLTEDEIKPDYIFLDLNMPIMTGQEFLAEIKKNQKLRDIPVFVLSTSSHPPTIENVKQLGAADFITKPDKFGELVRILTEILSR